MKRVMHLFRYRVACDVSNDLQNALTRYARFTMISQCCCDQSEKKRHILCITIGLPQSRNN